MNKERLKQHLIYDWYKYVIAIALAVIICLLSFFVVAPKIEGYEEYSFAFVVPAYTTSEYNKLETHIKNNSSLVLKNIDFNYLTEDGSETPVAIQARIKTKMLDALIISNIEEDTGNGKTKSKYKDYVDGGAFYNIEELLEEALVELVWTDDKEAEIRSFLKSKRNYRNAKNFEETIESIKVRYQKLLEDAKYVQRMIEENPQLFFSYIRGEQTVNLGEYTSIDDTERIWGLDLSKFKKIESLVSDRQELDEEGNPIKFEYCFGIVNGDLEMNVYEHLSVIKYLIETYAFES